MEACMFKGRAHKSYMQKFLFGNNWSNYPAHSRQGLEKDIISNTKS